MMPAVNMETIGKYRIEEKIGSGGFGEVFRAYDPFIKRHVAIKTCDADDRSIADRFYQEAEIGGNLHHRNITTVYDFGVHDGLPYLIQEYLSGEDLDVKVKRRDYLPYSEKLLYLLQIGRGLAYAHSKGFVHRDIKPANIRVLEDGTAKIMDFGIAKLAQQETGLTQTGMTLGTAAYLSPEQVRGDRVDVRTDIFSFGILAYELLTYERPFRGEQISTVIYNLLNHEPEPINIYWPSAPPEMVALVDRCLRKDASQRFADGSDLVRELERLKKRGRGGRPQNATPATTAPATPTVSAPVVSPPNLAMPTGPEPHDAQKATAPLPTVSAPPPAADEAEVPEAVTPFPETELASDHRADSPRSGVSGMIMLVILAAAAAAGGWWLGMRGQTGNVDPASTSVPGETAAHEGEGAPEITDQESHASTTPAVEDPDGTSTMTAAPEGASPAESPEPSSDPPPAAPTTGQLVLPKVSWTDQMTVRLGSKTYGLYREHRLRLPPGTYSAVFEVAGEETVTSYRPDSRSAQVRVIAGETSSLAVAIPQPGTFSVRPLPGRPQGQVTLNGEPLGPTPLTKVQRAPGGYTLEITPRDAEGEVEGLREEITLTAGEEVILSFDLDAGTLRTRNKAPQSASP